MNIGIDMMGGDFAPREAVKALQLYQSEVSTRSNLFLIGDQEQIQQLMDEYGMDAKQFTIVHAAQVIGMNEHPTKALKEKQQSSIAIGFYLLSTGKIDAFIGAGNTGAMLVGAMYTIKAIEGVLRPTISTIVPKIDGKTGLLLDVGINADCKPEYLQQFAILASLYAQHILGINNPRTGLINIGEEEGKGNHLAQATFPLLKDTKSINFVGNIEGRDVFYDKADVMVCDGFTGNVILKLAESVYDLTVERGLKDEYFDRFNSETYGGTPILGVSKPIIVGHGISKAMAFKNMILVSEKMIQTHLLDKIRQEFQTAKD